MYYRTFCAPGTLLLSPQLSDEGTAVLIVQMRTLRLHQEGTLGQGHTVWKQDWDLTRALNFTAHALYKIWLKCEMMEFPEHMNE